MFMKTLIQNERLHLITMVIESHFICLKMFGTSEQDLQYTVQTLVVFLKAARATTGCQREYSKVSQMMINSVRPRCLICFLTLDFSFGKTEISFLVFCCRTNVRSVFTLPLREFFPQLFPVSSL